MTNGSNDITITEAEWAEISDSLLWLQALEDAGVDNWSGIDFARETYEEYKAQEAKDQM